jgi:putative addiction module component (TIGR02574 family)
MSSQEIADAAMSLPISERAALAQDLWQSIDNELEAFDGVTLQELQRRDDELTSGSVEGRSHEEVMQAARSAIGCA